MYIFVIIWSARGQWVTNTKLVWHQKYSLVFTRDTVPYRTCDAFHRNHTYCDRVDFCRADQWCSQAEHGCMSPRRSWKWACVFGFWGLRRQTPTGPLPLDPAGVLPSPDPPVANSWLRPWWWWRIRSRVVNIFRQNQRSYCTAAYCLYQDVMFCPVCGLWSLYCILGLETSKWNSCFLCVLICLLLLTTDWLSKRSTTVSQSSGNYWCGFILDIFWRHIDVKSLSPVAITVAFFIT